MVIIGIIGKIVSDFPNGSYTYDGRIGTQFRFILVGCLAESCFIQQAFCIQLMHPFHIILIFFTSRNKDYLAIHNVQKIRVAGCTEGIAQEMRPKSQAPFVL